MTEKDIRTILRQVLEEWDRRLVTRVVMPTALGVGLALSGCGGRALAPTDAQPPMTEAGQQISVDGGRAGDGLPFVTEAGQPLYLDNGIAPTYMAPAYMAPAPDARITPPPQPDYMAPMYGGPFPEPDARITPPPQEDYAAPFPPPVPIDPDDGE